MGLFGDEKKIQQDLEVVMAKTNAVIRMMQEIQYTKIGIEGRPLTEQDNKIMKQASLELYRLLSVVSLKVRLDYITDFLQMSPIGFNQDNFYQSLKTSAFTQLLNEGKIKHDMINPE